MAPDTPTSPVSTPDQVAGETRSSAELAAEALETRELRTIRQGLLERAVAADPAAPDLQGDLDAMWGALPRARKDAIADQVDSDLAQLTRNAAREAVDAFDSFGVRPAAISVAGLVAVVLRRRELKREGATLIGGPSVE